MNSRALACVAVTVLFAALATPIRIAAQSEQPHHNNQADYFVKNLDTLEGTATLVESSSAASGIADKRRPDNDDPNRCGFYTGYCVWSTRARTN